HPKLASHLDLNVGEPIPALGLDPRLKTGRLRPLPFGHDDSSAANRLTAVVRPWDWTSTIVNTGHPGAFSHAKAPTPVFHPAVQGPGRARSPLGPEERGRVRPAAQAQTRTLLPLEGHRPGGPGGPL